MGAPPRLTAAQVAAARRLRMRGTASTRLLAGQFGVSVSAMKHALAGRTWAHLTDPPPVRYPITMPPTVGPTRVLTPALVLDLVRRRDEEATSWAELGRFYGVHRSAVMRAFRKATAQTKKAERQRQRRNDRLRQLWADGVSRKGIADRLGLRPGTVSKLAADLGLPPRRTCPRGVHPQRERLRELWPDDALSINRMSTMLGVSRPTITLWAQTLGLPPRHRD